MLMYPPRPFFPPEEGPRRRGDAAYARIGVPAIPRKRRVPPDGHVQVRRRRIAGRSRGVRSNHTLRQSRNWRNPRHVTFDLDCAAQNSAAQKCTPGGPNSRRREQGRLFTAYVVSNGVSPDDQGLNAMVVQGQPVI